MRRAYAILTRLSAIAAIMLLLAVPALALEPGGVDHPDVLDLLTRGADLQYQGKQAEAEALFAQVLALEPDNLFALNRMALACATQDRLDQARQLFEKVLVLDSGNSFARLWSGVLYLAEDRPDQALAAFESVLEQDPGNVDACYFMGVVYATLNDTTQALRWLKQAQDLGSDDPATHWRLARAFSGLGMPANARLELELALDLDPEHLPSLKSLGWVLFNEGQVLACMEAWEKALALAPDDADLRADMASALGHQALAADRAGNKALAAAMWGKALAYEPKNKAAQHFFAHNSSVME